MAALPPQPAKGIRTFSRSSQWLQRHLKGSQDFIIGAICQRQKVERAFYQSCLQAGFGGGQSPDQQKLSLPPIIFRRRHRTRPLMVDRLTHRRPQQEPKITRIGQSSNIEGLELLELLLANLAFSHRDFHRSKKTPSACLGSSSLPQCSG